MKKRVQALNLSLWTYVVSSILVPGHQARAQSPRRVSLPFSQVFLKGMDSAEDADAIVDSVELEEYRVQGTEKNLNLSESESFEKEENPFTHSGRTEWPLVMNGEIPRSAMVEYVSVVPKSATGLNTEAYPFHGYTYRIVFKNRLGREVVKFALRTKCVYGKIPGYAGVYLPKVQLIPIESSKSWGWNLDSKASLLAVTNQGTKIDPRASVTMNVRIDVGTLLQRTHVGLALHFSGDGQAHFRY